MGAAEEPESVPDPESLGAKSIVSSRCPWQIGTVSRSNAMSPKQNNNPPATSLGTVHWNRSTFTPTNPLSAIITKSSEKARPMPSNRRFPGSLLSLLLAFGAMIPTPSASADEPPAGRPVIVIGFVGGFVKHDNAVHSEVQLATRLRQDYPFGVHVEVFENQRREKAHQQILRLLDIHNTGSLSAQEKQQARIIIYGHSWGASETVTLARDRKSTRLNSSHGYISYAVFCLKKKKNIIDRCHAIRAHDKPRPVVRDIRGFTYDSKHTILVTLHDVLPYYVRMHLLLHRLQHNNTRTASTALAAIPQ